MRKGGEKMTEREISDFEARALALSKEYEKLNDDMFKRQSGRRGLTLFDSGTPNLILYLEYDLGHPYWRVGWWDRLGAHYKICDTFKEAYELFDSKRIIK